MERVEVRLAAIVTDKTAAEMATEIAEAEFSSDLNTEAGEKFESVQVAVSEVGADTCPHANQIAFSEDGERYRGCRDCRSFWPVEG